MVRIYLASTALLAVLLGTTLVQAEAPIQIHDNTPINVISDPTPISVHDNTPVNVGDMTPVDVNVAKPGKGINDAVLAGGKGGKTFGGRTLKLALSCKAGSNELLAVRNLGDAVPAGTKLRWFVQSIGEHGTVRLKSTLGAGETVRVDVGQGIEAGTPCAVQVI